MPHLVTIVGQDEHLEEEVLININGIEMAVFLVHAPHSFHIGDPCLMDLSLFFVDDANVRLSASPVRSVVRQGASLAYELNGLLDQEGRLDVGFVMEDELLSELPQLFGEYVSVRVDRIDAAIVDQDGWPICAE